MSQGGPQRRERIVQVGSVRRGIGIPSFQHGLSGRSQCRPRRVIQSVGRTVILRRADLLSLGLGQLGVGRNAKRRGDRFHPGFAGSNYEQVVSASVSSSNPALSRDCMTARWATTGSRTGAIASWSGWVLAANRTLRAVSDNLGVCI